MSRYGNDKPDIRFGLELREVTELFGATDIQVFKDVIAQGGIIRGIVVPNAPFSRKEIDDLLPLAVSFGAKGTRVVPDSRSPVGNRHWQRTSARSKKAKSPQLLSLKTGDLVLLIADKEKLVCDVLSRLRLSLGEKLGLIPKDEFSFLWVTDFPLLEYDAEAKRYVAMHHPFTSPTRGRYCTLGIQPRADTCTRLRSCLERCRAWRRQHS